MPPFSKKIFFSLVPNAPGSPIGLIFFSFSFPNAEMHLVHQSVQCLVVSVPPRMQFHDSRPAVVYCAKRIRTRTAPSAFISEIATTGHHGNSNSLFSKMHLAHLSAVQFLFASVPPRSTPVSADLLCKVPHERIQRRGTVSIQRSPPPVTTAIALLRRRCNRRASLAVSGSNRRHS
jgi:hypothetical protein